MSSASVLSVQGLDVRYGGVRAVVDLNIELAAGEIVGLIGPNGAGKTSAIDGITGYAPTAGGSVVLGGQSLSGKAAHVRARAGLARTFQQLELFTDLTVEDNLLLAARASRRGDATNVQRSLDRFGLQPIAGATIASLPQGVRRLVAIARSYAASPVALLLDEPAAGLDNHESDVLHARLRDMAADGIAVLLVEHDMALVMKTCDRLVVLEYGKTIGVGSPEQIRNDPRIVEAYLGVEREDVAHA